MSPAAITLIFVTAISFGSSLIASRIGLAEFSPLGYIAYRLLVAGGAFLIMYVVGYQAWPRERYFWRHMVFIGILGTGLPMYAYVTALLYLSSGLTSIFSASGPALTVLLAHFLLADERLNGRKGLGVLLALAGAILLVVLGESGLPDVDGSGWEGYVLVTIGLLCVAGNTIYVRKNLKGYPSFQVTSMQVIVGAAVVVPIAALSGDLSLAGVTWLGYSSLLYGSLIGTFAAFWLYTRLIQEHGATPAALTNYVIPIVATIGGVLLLNETITWGMTAGVALILSGIALLNWGQRVKQLVG